MVEYTLQNWKLITHLLLGTYRFGVNNHWWNSYDSLFGIPWYKRTPHRMLTNYRGMKFRALKCYFITSETANKIWPKG